MQRYRSRLRLVSCSKGGCNTETADRAEAISYPLGRRKYAAVLRDQSARGPGSLFCLHRATPIDIQASTADETAVEDALSVSFSI